MSLFDFGFGVSKKICLCVLDEMKLIFQEYSINVNIAKDSIIRKEYHLSHILRTTDTFCVNDFCFLC